MNLLSCFTLLTSATLCAALVGCAGGVESGPATVVRTPAPLNYEKTITNYLAFRIRGPQKNAEISVGAPEPGACPLDGYLTSTRGWVVPVAYATRSGDATGKDTIRINAKQYYFWFLGNTIAGITPRIELCPGVGSGFESPAPAPSAAPLLKTATPLPASAEPQRDDAAAREPRAQDAGKTTSGQKRKATSSTKKAAASSGKATSQAHKKNEAGANPHR